MHSPTPVPRTLQALLLLHLLVFAALGAVGAGALFLAYLSNDVHAGTLLAFAFGAAAAASAWGFYALSSRNPFRNRRALAAMTMLAWADTALVAASLPLLFFRLQPVPAAAYLAVVPTAAFALLASRHLARAVRGRNGVGAPE